jgi:hypothetical protein
MLTIKQYLPWIFEDLLGVPGLEDPSLFGAIRKFDPEYYLITQQGTR